MHMIRSKNELATALLMHTLNKKMRMSRRCNLIHFFVHQSTIIMVSTRKQNTQRGNNVSYCITLWNACFVV